MQPNGFRFSRQEEKVLALSMSGMSDKEIANHMGIGLGTVRTFWKRIRSKAGGSTRTEVITAMASAFANQELDAVQDHNVHLMSEMARRQAAEEQARRREEEFRLLAEAVPDSVFVFQDGKATFINDHWLDWSGTKDQAEESGFWSSVHPDEREDVQRKWHESLNSNQPSQFTCQLRYKDGTYRTNEVRSVPSGQEPGGVKRRIVVVREADNPSAENRGEHLDLRGTSDPAFIIDSFQQICAVSDKALSLLNLTREELVGTEVSRIVLAGSLSRKGTVTLRDKHGQPFQMVVCQVLSLGDKTLVVADRSSGLAEHTGESVFEEAFQRTRVGIAVIDPEGSLLLVNDRFADLIGHQVSAMEDLRLPAFVTFSDRKRLEAVIARADSEGDAQGGITMLHANGGLVTVLMDVSSIKEGGQVVRRVVTVRRTADATRRY